MKVGPAWNTCNKQKHASEEFNRDISQISDLITGIEMKRGINEQAKRLQLLFGKAAFRSHSLRVMSYSPS